VFVRAPADASAAARVTTPKGFGAVPVPIANAEPSSRDRASSNSRGTWSDRLVSSITSNDPKIHVMIL